MRARSLSAPAALGAVALLAGCTFSVGQSTAPTIDPEHVATTAADALERQSGVRPEVDCGEEPLPLEADREVLCLLVDPVAGLEYDAVITFTEVAADGRSYSIDVAVAEVPNNAPEPTVEPGADEAPTVSGDDLAALAIQALSPTLGFVPQIRCPEAEVAIVVGNTTSCSFDDQGGSHDVEVEIIAYDPDAGDYRIAARVLN